MAEVIFYERPVPLNRTAHKELRLKGVPNMKFALSAHSVPLTGAEFPLAAHDFPIMFAGQGIEDASPMVLLGLRQNENLFLDTEGHWEPGAYIPAFVRRYPFVLAEKPAGEEGDDFTVFLDEGYEGFGTSDGERLFKDDGSDSEMLTKAVGFLSEFQQQVARTKWFMDQLRKHDLLEPRNIRLAKTAADGSEGPSINLSGLLVVNEDKLRGLDEHTAHEFAREGMFGWIYAHLLSLGNIERVAGRLARREELEAATSTTRN